MLPATGSWWKGRAVLRPALEAMLQSQYRGTPLGRWEEVSMKALSSTGWQGSVLHVRTKKRVTQVQPQPIQPDFYGHTDAAEWKDVWNARKCGTSRWFSPGMSGSLGWLACTRETLIRTASMAFVCWLVPQERKLQRHAASGSEPELFIPQIARARSPRFGS